MTNRMIGRAVLVVAAGLLLFASLPAHAAKGDAAAEKTEAAAKPGALTKPAKSRLGKTRQSRASKQAALKAAKKAAFAAKQSRIKAASAKEKQLPAAVANAQALMTGADARGGADIADAAPLEVAAADQLNELGRALAAPPTDDTPGRLAMQLVVNDQPQSAMPQSVSATAAPEVAPSPAVSQARSSPSGDPWAQSSLVGKLFIAFGGMLTLASAARMLVA